MNRATIDQLPDDIINHMIQHQRNQVRRAKRLVKQGNASPLLIEMEQRSLDKFIVELARRKAVQL